MKYVTKVNVRLHLLEKPSLKIGLRLSEYCGDQIRLQELNKTTKKKLLVLPGCQNQLRVISHLPGPGFCAHALG